MDDISVKEVVWDLNAIGENVVEDKHWAFWLVYRPIHICWIEIVLDWKAVFFVDRCKVVEVFALFSFGDHGSVFDNHNVVITIEPALVTPSTCHGVEFGRRVQEVP